MERVMHSCPCQNPPGTGAGVGSGTGLARVAGRTSSIFSMSGTGETGGTPTKTFLQISRARAHARARTEDWGHFHACHPFHPVRARKL